MTFQNFPSTFITTVQTTQIMALKELQFRVDDIDHARLKAVAEDRNKAMGKIVDSLLVTATAQDVANAIVNRGNNGNKIEKATKKTISLVSQAALDNLYRLGAVTGLPRDFLVRLLLEYKLALESQPQHD